MDRTPTAATGHAPHVLARRYRLLDVIGRGGMSTVYRANDGVLDRVVAVKVLAPALAEADPASVARFEREARAAAALTHQGVATVYDTGIQGDTRYIVMELVDGESLDGVIRAQAPLAPARAVQIAAQVADVLSAAHAAGIIHRDVKPANVMVGAQDRVKVLDFGIARALNAAALTQTVSVVGTAAYMSPEQAIGQPADPRSDVYSLGCVLYAMLTGRPPFSAELAAAVLHQQVHAEPPPLHAAVAGVPGWLEALVAQMLAKSPPQRPQSAAEVRDRLLGRSGPEPLAADPTAPTVAAGATAATSVLAPEAIDPTLAAAAAGRAGWSEPPPRARSRRGTGWLALLALALAVVAAAAVALASSGGTNAPGTNVPPAAQPSAPAATSTRAPSTTAPPPTSTAPATSSTSTTTPTTTPSTTAPAPPPPPPAGPGGHKPPGHGGVPPGHAKKGG